MSPGEKLGGMILIVLWFVLLYAMSRIWEQVRKDRR